MPMQLIPRDKWLGFLEGFSRQHRQWLVNVERHGADGRTEAIAREVPLHSISAGRDNKIVVTLGGKDTPDRDEVIWAPQDILLSERDDGAREGLRIDQSDGAYVDIRFRAPARPEQLNGIKQ